MKIVHAKNYYQNLDLKMKKVRLSYIEHKESNDLNRKQFMDLNNSINSDCIDEFDDREH